MDQSKINQNNKPKAKLNFAKKKQLHQELTFQTSRSGGPGGQNVNKVNSKVTLYFDVLNSKLLRDVEKKRIKNALENRLSKEGVLIIHAQSERTQLANKQAAIKRFEQILEKVCTPQKKRKPTKATLSSQKERLNRKKKHGEKKQNRKKVDY